MKRRIVAIVFVLVLVITACAPKVQSEDLMKDISADVVDGDPAVTVNGADVSDFAIRLLRANGVGDKNVLLSPMSILCALGMTANGAQGETLQQMENALGIPITMLNNYIYGYQKVLPQSNNCKLNLANSIWFTDDDKLSVTPSFLQVNADYYGADMYQTPFNKSTLRDINNWVKKETDGMIPEILDEITGDAVMYLINALSFEAKWEEVYKKDRVTENIFTKEDGERQTTSFMHSTEGYYLEDDRAKGFLKFYKDSNYAFVALLPKEGITISEYIASMDGEQLDELLAQREHTAVQTSIPKFETEYSTELSEALRNMGMPKAFDDELANFSELGIYEGGQGNIYIGRVIHKTYISVGEKGTKAGAATAVEIKSSGTMMVEEKEVYLDRPFVYMLVDCTTNVPFFIGTMMDVEG